MPNVTITQLPAAGPITGTEAVAIVQNGQTLRTTTGAIAASPAQTQTFLTLNQEPTLPNSRTLSTGTGLSLTDGGALSTLQINLSGASGSLEGAGNGVVVKTASNTISARQITTTGAGLDIVNGNGVSGNPTLALTGLAAAVANLGGTGIVAVNNGTTMGGVQILGTADQIDVTNGNGAGNPTLALADNPVIPGNEGITLPTGTTAQQPIGVQGQIRFNSDTQTFDGFSAGLWRQFSTAMGVSAFSAGATGFTPTTPTSGAVTLSGILNAAHGGTGLSSYTAGDIIYASGATTLTKLAIGTAGQVLQVNTGTPEWVSTTGTGNVVRATSPTLVTPVLGTPTSGTLTTCTGLPISTGVSGLGTNVATALAVNVGSSGAFVVNGGALGTPSSGTLTSCSGLPVSTGISGLGANVATFLATPSSANLAAAVTDETGSGLLVFDTSPTLVTPVLGAATATSINKVAFTSPATGSTLTIADGKTLTASNTLTFTGTDSSSIAFGTGGTVTYTSNNLSVFASTTSAQLAGVISDETGSGSLVFASSPTLATPTFTTSATGPLLIGGTTTTSTLILRSTSGAGTAGADIILQAGNNGATELMRLQNGGNVGIGTASPAYKLDVSGTANFSGGVAGGTF